MKVIIDLIEDIRSAINNDKDFSLRVMGLKEDKNAQFVPSWQSDLCSYKLDQKAKKLFIFLGQEEAINLGVFLDVLNVLENEEMMYEVNISYTKEGGRINSSLLGFGESLPEKKYLLFVEG